MRRGWIALLVATVGVGGWLVRDAQSEEGAPSEDAMMKMMEELGRPGEPHKWLAETEGTWDVAVKEHTMSGVVESKAVATFKPILGGRFVEQSYTGTIHGRPYEGRGLSGYDNAKKEYFFYWFNNMGTSASLAKGQREGDKLSLSGTWETTPMGPMPFRETLEKKGPKQLLFTIHMTMQGAEMPVLELTYTKR